MLAFVLHLDSLDLVFIALTILATLFIYLLWHNWPKERQPLPLRKVALYLAFLSLGVAFLFGEPLAHWLANLAYGVHDAPGAVEASPELKEAAARVGGWVPVGTATSKIILATSFYVLTWLLPWLVQQVTHPGLTAWAKGKYSTDFDELPAARKFENNRGLSLSQSIRIAASILGAALIQ
jgi:hypothetical protein